MERLPNVVRFLGATFFPFISAFVTTATIDEVVFLNLYRVTFHKLALQSKQARIVSVADVQFLLLVNDAVVLVSHKFVL